MNKIALGTVQFGMDYGISNKRGKIPKDEVFEILNKASENGIDTLDTAYLYGESETVIGEFIKIYNNKFKLITKSPNCKVEQIEDLFDVSLKKLNINKIYGYLIHNFQHYKKDQKIWNILEKLKTENKIQKIGFSLYYPSELEYLLKKKLEIDIIQVPYSIFDQRFEPFFKDLQNRNVEIHVRSVFLQGLVFKNPDELDSYFSKIKEKMLRLNSVSIKHNIPIGALCLDFVILNDAIDKVVVGVESIENFKENISSLNYLTDVGSILHELSLFKEDDENIILPVNWTVKKV
ncbi:MAG TPA: aldo/keto reductase [Candidatus Methanoperedens sp.]